MVVGPIEVAFDVATDNAQAQIAGWLFAPERDCLAEQPRVFVCVPGGSYTKSYYHTVIPGHADYSMAQYLANKGHVVLALDPLGVGESTHPEPNGGLLATTIAAANDAAARQALARIRDGTLLPELGPTPTITSVGVGHSIGGMLVTLQQSEHRTFDALAILGFATVEPLDQVRLAAAERAMAGSAAHLDFAALGDYVTINREGLRNVFHYPDVPTDVIAADDARAVPVIKDAALHTMVPSLVADKTQALDVPLFLGFGEIDLVVDFRREPPNYATATDLTLHLLPESGHCSNFASTRRQLWDRLAAWADSIAG